MGKYNICAHARPRFRPFIPLDGKNRAPVYPVSPWCAKAVRYKAVEPNGYLPALADREFCEECPRFTQPDNRITIRSGNFRANIYLDRLGDLSIAKLRKLIKLIRADPGANEEAIGRLTTHLDQAVRESKDAWKKASKEFVNGWREVGKPKSRRPVAVEILKNNNRLTRCLKAAKTRHERWVKIQALWNDTGRQKTEEKEKCDYVSE